MQISSSIEKDETLKIENVQPQKWYSDDELKAVVRKLDWHLLPLCFTLYSFSVLDRSNLGNARLAGLEEDLKLTSSEYDWLGTAFYIAYIIFQFTSLGWKIFKPHQWVTFAVLFWGIVSTLQATCSSFGGLLACRFFLGIAETCFGPGLPLYFSFFYPRSYIGLRFGLVLSGAALANAYGGALAYGLSHIHSSVSNWKLLFIIDGCPTVLLAGVCWFFLPDSIHKAKFLTERECNIALHHVGHDQKSEEVLKEARLNLEDLKHAFTDYRNWMFGLSNFSTNVSFASLPLFLPTIISDFGTFDRLTSNGLSAPPYLLTFFLTITVGFISDKVRLRGPLAACFAFLSAVGYLILALTTTVAARYVSCFLIVNVFVTVAVVLVWNANTNENESKRAGGVWIIQTIGQCGTVLGTNSFPKADGPYYRRGMWTGFSFSLLSATICSVLSFLLWKENKRRDALYGKPDQNVLSEQNSDMAKDAEARFRYII